MDTPAACSCLHTATPEFGPLHRLHDAGSDNARIICHGASAFGGKCRCWYRAPRDLLDQVPLMDELQLRTFALTLRRAYVDRFGREPIPNVIAAIRFDVGPLWALEDKGA
jgi:hypothetical protein